jgi:uncharacterized protein GlcG (DUF336 family)
MRSLDHVPDGRPAFGGNTALPRSDHPSTPSQELAERRAWTGATLANGVLTEELAAFCQSGISIVMANRDSLGHPVVARGLACRIDNHGLVRIIYLQTQNTAFHRAVSEGAPIAATFTNAHSHRSIQLKAQKAVIARPAPLDAPAAFRQTSAFREQLIDVGYTDAFSAGYTRFDAADLSVVEFLPESAFVQTPGPDAGEALT